MTVDYNLNDTIDWLTEYSVIPTEFSNLVTPLHWSLSLSKLV